MILFKFLTINLRKKTLYYNLYCDMRTNANKLRLMAECWDKGTKVEQIIKIVTIVAIVTIV